MVKCNCSSDLRICCADCEKAWGGRQSISGADLEWIFARSQESGDLLLSLLIRFRLELLILDNKTLVAATADLSFCVVSGNIEYETASVDLDKLCLTPYSHS